MGGLAVLAELDPALPRYVAVTAYLYERDRDPVTAARLNCGLRPASAPVDGGLGLRCDGGAEQR